jgi:ParB family chromosome partitioning protein
MRKWFTSTAGNYFGRISKTGILVALREAKGDTASAWEKAKKGELAALAEREPAATGWLPEILRFVMEAHHGAEDEA